MDSNAVVPVFVPASEATGAAVKKALAARYARLGLREAYLSLYVDGQRWNDDEHVGSVATSSSTVTARSAVRSMRLRLEEAMPHNPRAKGHSARVRIQQPVLGQASDPKVIEETVRQLAKATGAGHVDSQTGRTYMVVVGDFQTYAILLNLAPSVDKYTLVPWIGDWHLLWHLQANIISQYWAFGLCQLAELDVGTGAGPLAYLASGKRFEDNAVFLRRVMDAVGQVVCEGSRTHGVAWVQKRKSEDRTFALWLQLLDDVVAVSGLHTAIRTGNFDLRQACLKRLAYLFHVQGKHNYVRLVTTHLRQVATLSPYLSAVMRAHFSVSVWDHGHANLALDETLEKTVNRTGKGIVRSVDGPQAIKELKAFSDLHDARQQIQHELGLKGHPHIHAASYLTERDVEQMVARLRPGLLMNAGTERKDVVNVFTGVVAPTAVADQFARAREIGQHRLERHVLQFGHGITPPPLTPDETLAYGKLPSKLATMTVRTPTAKKKDAMLDNVERQLEVARQVLLKSAASGSSEGGGGPGLDVIAEYEKTSRDVLREPLCFTDGTGIKLKANKSAFAKHLARLIGGGNHADLFQAPPPRLRPDVVIHDVLVAMHAQPHGGTFGEYAASLMHSLVTMSVQAGAKTVVLIWDNPDGLNVAKVVERGQRRERHTGAIDLAKELRTITSKTVLPARARWVDSVVSQDPVRRSLVTFLRTFALNEYVLPAPSVTLIVDVGDGTPIERRTGSAPTPAGDLAHSCLEADYACFHFARRMRERALRAGDQEPSIVVSSVDTDVWVYALLLCSTGMYQCGEQRLWIARRPNEMLDVQRLCVVLGGALPSTMQLADVVACFLLSGCDYTSRWAGFTHRTMLDLFIAGGRVLERCLQRAGAPPSSTARLISRDEGGRLCIVEDTFNLFVAYAYHSRYRKVFKPDEELDALVPVGAGYTCIDACRATYGIVKARTLFATADQRLGMPTLSAAQFHRRRAEFALRLAPAGLNGGQGLPDALEHGYVQLRPADRISTSNLAVQWDDAAVSAVVPGATSCNCKGGCGSRRCACRRGQQVCTTTCRCASCTNTPADAARQRRPSLNTAADMDTGKNTETDAPDDGEGQQEEEDIMVGPAAIASESDEDDEDEEEAEPSVREYGRRRRRTHRTYGSPTAEPASSEGEDGEDSDSTGEWNDLLLLE